MAKRKKLTKAENEARKLELEAYIEECRLEFLKEKKMKDMIKS